MNSSSQHVPSTRSFLPPYFRVQQPDGHPPATSIHCCSSPRPPLKLPSSPRALRYRCLCGHLSACGPRVWLTGLASVSSTVGSEEPVDFPAAPSRHVAGIGDLLESWKAAGAMAPLLLAPLRAPSHRDLAKFPTLFFLVSLLLECFVLRTLPSIPFPVDHGLGPVLGESDSPCLLTLHL